MNSPARSAIKTRRWRVLRQLLVESVLLSTLGALLGLLVAFWSVGAITRLPAANLPRVVEVGLNLQFVGFALLISLLSAFLFGLVPALHASKPCLSDALRNGTRATDSGPRNRVRSALIVSEVAI